MSDVRLLHLHLPKTGGTALWHFFAEQLGERRISPPQQAILLREALLRWRTLPVISGHFITKHGDNIPADRMGVTVVRDPVDRFLSEYFYNRFDGDNRPVEASRRGMELDAYLDHLTQSASHALLVQMEMLYPLGTDRQTQLSSEEKLAASMQAIDRFDLIGIQSETDDFCSMLCAKLGWPPVELRRVNITSRRLDCSALQPHQRRLVERLVEPETMLYEHARKRFQKDRRGFIALSSGKIVAESEPESNAEVAFLPGQESIQGDVTARSPEDFGDRRCVIDHIEVHGRISGPNQVMTGEIMDVFFHVTAHESVDHVNVGLAIMNDVGGIMYGTNSLGQGAMYSLHAGKYIFKFSIFNRLGIGVFFINGALTPTGSHYDGCYHWRHAAAQFNVPSHAIDGFEGQVLMDAKIDIDCASDTAAYRQTTPDTPHSAARTLGNVSNALTSFRSSFQVMSTIDTAQRNSDLLLQVKLTNLGSEPWPAGGRYPTRISYRWVDPDGNVVVGDGLRSDLPFDIPPDDNLIALMLVRTPESPGKINLVASLVQEHVAWFVDQDCSNGATLPVTVT
ncbi:MAG: Wzt carbohydrate-binding domain-containing protein [Rhodanobacter sp.]|nr:Wzt carbohydrate-binding domain-containing protein [Rhodanobacter sp.]